MPRDEHYGKHDIYVPIGMLPVATETKPANKVKVLTLFFYQINRFVIIFFFFVHKGNYNYFNYFVLTNF